MGFSNDPGLKQLRVVTTFESVNHNGVDAVNITLASSEIFPFARTGGLGDVCGALPKALSAKGHNVSVIMPAYKMAMQSENVPPIKHLDVKFTIPVGDDLMNGSLLQSQLPESGVTVYLIQQDHYYNRDGIYGDKNGTYTDNSARYIFFSRAVLETIRKLQLPVDVLHTNDWQTGLVPAYLNLEYRDDPLFRHIATLHTIHNLQYQGEFWHWDMLLTGLDWKYFNWHQLECHGKLNLLKTGIAFADAISTVSPRYSQEIQTEQFGEGLEGVLQYRSESLHGILNGIDPTIWSPEVDEHLSDDFCLYDAGCHMQGKAACKQALQRQLGLHESPDVPLIAFIGRLAEQKGVELLKHAARSGSPVNAQWAILGGAAIEEKHYEHQLEDLQRESPGRIAFSSAFDNPLSHRMIAAADMLVMPSLFEPCGLCQLYALRYGTIPIARHVGGLADTVNEENGFVFYDFTTDSFTDAVCRAVDCYNNDPAGWQQRIETGMRQDYSWDHEAETYEDVFESIMSARREKTAT